MTLSIGFTGSRHGMTPQQMQSIKVLLVANCTPTEVHHGLCVGADGQFHKIIRELFPNCKIAGHPPINLSKMLAGLTYECNWMYQPKDYLERDRDIVHSCDILLATPNSYAPAPRSGTWYTIQYALHKNVPVYIVYPDGREEHC